MAIPTTRAEFADYCLRKLGHPVIEINVSDEQVDDRIDEAIYYWTDYHYNGAEHVYLKHTITSDDVNSDGSISITMSDRIVGITRLMSESSFSGAIGGFGGFMDFNYQYFLNNMHDIAGTDIDNYYMSMEHISLLREWVTGIPLIRYNRSANILRLDDSQYVVGDTIVLDGYAMIDGDEYCRMWGDRWLQNYATILIKEQWGRNLTKFQNMQLVGGVQFNGEQILRDAMEERQRIEDKAEQGNFSFTMGFIG